MANAEFWRKLKDEFKELANQEYIVVPDPGDGRRLQARGEYPPKERSTSGAAVYQRSLLS